MEHRAEKLFIPIPSRYVQVPGLHDPHIPRQHLSGGEAHTIAGHHVCLVNPPLLCASAHREQGSSVEND